MDAHSNYLPLSTTQAWSALRHAHAEPSGKTDEGLMLGKPSPISRWLKGLEIIGPFVGGFPFFLGFTCSLVMVVNLAYMRKGWGRCRLIKPH